MTATEVKQVVDKILALRAITVQTGMVTRRAQNALLAPLNDADLAAVALELQRTQESSKQ